MKPSKVLWAITGGMDAIIRPLGFVACGVAAIMALVVVSNVVGRFLFDKPLLGTVELVEFLMIIVVFFAMPYTTMKRRHVRVDVVTSRLSRRTQAILASTAFFLSAGIFAFITYQATVNAIFYTQHLEQTSALLLIPLAPFRCVMALGCLLVCLKRLLDVFNPLPIEEWSKGGSSK